jgi:hypothetical protein
LAIQVNFILLKKCGNGTGNKIPGVVIEQFWSLCNNLSHICAAIYRNKNSFWDAHSEKTGEI